MSSFVVPACITVGEYAFNVGLGRMLQMALWLGALWSVAAGGLGTLLAARFGPKRRKHDA